MLGKGTYMVGPSKSSTLVPSGAIGVQFKLNTQLKYDSAERWGLIFDARRMLMEGSAWRRMRSQGGRVNWGCSWKNLQLGAP